MKSTLLAIVLTYSSAHASSRSQRWHEEFRELGRDMAAGLVLMPEDVRQPLLRAALLRAYANPATLKAARARHADFSDVEALAIALAEDTL
jgi:hypothetical protein